MRSCSDTDIDPLKVCGVYLLVITSSHPGVKLEPKFPCKFPQSTCAC